MAMPGRLRVAFAGSGPPLRVFENVENAGHLPLTEQLAATFALIDSYVTDRQDVGRPCSTRDHHQKEATMRIRLIHFALAVLVAVGLSSTTPPQRAAARIGTPNPASPLAVRAESTLPDTPVGHQLEWVLERLSGRGEPLTQSDVSARFAPSFLDTVSAADTVATTQQFAAAYGPLSVGGLVRNPTGTQALVFLTARTGDSLIVISAVEPADPHRITTLTFQPVPDGLADATTGLEHTGGLIDIGGRSLYLWCLGPVPTDGELTVLLEAGYGDDSTVWLAVQAALASDTRVCSYDRANAPGGASDPA